MPDGLSVRAATAADAAAIDTVVCAAFAATEFGHQGEADLVRMVEADADGIVSLIAEGDGAVVGHILFSRMDVEADGAPLSAAGLAPLSVIPGKQGQGIGGMLIRAGLCALRERGIAISFVLGHDGYYPSFGYSPALAAHFDSPYAGPHFMAMMLDSGTSWPLGGRADYAPAFSRIG